MSLRKTAPMTACLWAIAAHVATAQRDTARSLRTELAAAIGIAHTERLDATASPVRFGGQGYDVVVHYRRTRGATSITAFIDGGTRDLEPQANKAGTDERLTSGDVHVSVRRALHGLRLSAGGVRTMIVDVRDNVGGQYQLAAEIAVASPIERAPSDTCATETVAATATSRTTSPKRCRRTGHDNSSGVCSCSRIGAT